MVKIKIDNTDHEVQEGTTILDAAKSAGITIPTLCHMNGIPHYSSCMVCMVKDNRSNGYIPSCSALVQPGMDIDASGNEVIAIRKKAVELLLSEHRAECEAPCRIVCPAGYNIPLMNRFLSAGKFDKAVELSLSELDSDGIHCTTCPGYCENACRRKKIDIPVSIKSLQLFISGKIKPEDKPVAGTMDDETLRSSGSENVTKVRIKSKRFSSHIGKIESSELNEWLKECSKEQSRLKNIADNDSASSESESCMHCDCRAAEDCRLREMAELFSVRDPGYKLVYSPAAKKINLRTNLIFENAKCIKCGLCVRICTDKNDDPPLCFINRGFVSIISEPLTCTFDETMKSTADECIRVCPTGALAYFNNP